jgi:soluble lytic murein transglycosylase-like protein
MVKIHAAKNGLDWRLVAAHITAESGWNASLVSNKNAIGLAQVLCTPDGNGGCANKLPAIAIWPTITQQKLFDPDTNVETACQIMAWNQENYGLWRGIAVYENWSAHKGVIHDVVYMERVLCSLHKLQQEYPPNE